MRIELLKYFYTICQTGSINSAAQQLFISQQGLNNAIHRLEKELDTTLFLRSNNGIQLTEEGKILQKYAEKFITLSANLELELGAKKLSSTTPHNLQIVTNPLYSAILADFFQTFSDKLPQIRYSISEMANDDIVKTVFDTPQLFGIISYNNSIIGNEARITKSFETYHIKYSLLFEDELVIFMGHQNPLADKSYLSDEDLLYSNIILSDNIANAYKTYIKSNSIILNSTDFSLQQYYLSSRDCISCLPKIIGTRVFDPSKILYRRYATPVYNKIALISTKSSNEYSVEETLFFNSLMLYLQSYTKNNLL